MQIKTFIKQCREHDLFKMLSIYVVSSWVILQVLSVTWQPLGLPEKSVTFLIITLLICLPIYLFIIWKYKIVPLEKERLLIDNDEDLEEDPDKPLVKKSFKKYYIISSIFITTICAFAAFFIVDINFIKSAPTVSFSETDRIAVLKFGNNTGNPKYDEIGKMASDWIMHGITENKLGQVISPDVIKQYNSAFNENSKDEADNKTIKRYLKPAKIISGNYYLKNDKLVFQATITDGKTDKTIYSFKPQDCLDANPLMCIEKLESAISGFFATEGKKKLMLQESPPNYEAYRLVLESNYVEYDENYLQLIEKAISLDPNYFEPQVLRVAYYYNSKKYAIADSLLGILKPTSNRNDRQKNLLNLYAALLKGNNKKVYQANYKEFEYAPYDLANNSTTMIVGLQYVYKVKEVDSIYNLVKNDSLNIENCYECINRIYIKSLADIELKNYDTAIQLLEKSININNDEILKKPYLTALIRNGNDAKVKSFLNKTELTESAALNDKLDLYAGIEYLMVNKKDIANSYFKKVTDNPEVKLQEKALAEFYSENYRNAETYLTDFIKENANNYEARAFLAISKYKGANQKEAQTIIQNLEKLRKPYQFGAIDYSLALYYAAIGDSKIMYEYLLKSIASGHKYEPHSYNNDVFFKEYKNSKQFEKVMNFWQ